MNVVSLGNLQHLLSQNSQNKNCVSKDPVNIHLIFLHSWTKTRSHYKAFRSNARSHGQAALERAALTLRSPACSCWPPQGDTHLFYASHQWAVSLEEKVVYSHGAQNQWRSHVQPNSPNQINKSGNTFQLLEPFLRQAAGPHGWKLGLMKRGTGLICRRHMYEHMHYHFWLWLLAASLSLHLLICKVQMTKQLSPVPWNENKAIDRKTPEKLSGSRASRHLFASISSLGRSFHIKLQHISSFDLCISAWS